MPLLKVKSAPDARSKWQRNLTAAIDDIRKGVEATVKEWEDNTARAAKTWKDAVTETGVEKRFEQGVKAVGNDGWKEPMLRLGVDRIRTGVEVKAGKYEAGIAPYLDALAKIDKDPRKPRGHPDNTRIVIKIASTLNALRLKLKGGA